jgi:hypothetical protein
MSNEQINIAIAEACGIHGPWKEQITPCGCDGQWDFYNPKDVRLPDYCNDLNAMHEAERALNIDEEYHYGEELAAMIRRPENTLAGVSEDTVFPLNGWGFYSVAHATARQRAEAFLRTVGKWEEAE